jgi:hypothetical protein
VQDASGTVPGDDDNRAEVSLLPGKRDEYDQVEVLSVGGLSIRVDTENCIIKSSLATGSKRKSRPHSDGMAGSYAKAFKIECTLGDVSVTSLP